MREGTGVLHRWAPQWMLVPLETRLRLGAIRVPKLAARDPGEFGPEALGGLDIPTLVEVDAHSQPRLIDLEEVTQPGAKEADHLRIAVRELHTAITLPTFARIERDACGEEGFVVERSDPLDTTPVHLLNFSELPFPERVAATLRAATASRRREGHI